MDRFIEYLTHLGFTETSKYIFHYDYKDGWIEVIIDEQSMTAQKISKSKFKDHPVRGGFVDFDVMGRSLSEQLRKK